MLKLFKEKIWVKEIEKEKKKGKGRGKGKGKRKRRGKEKLTILKSLHRKL